jgi:type II secretory pathway pseudopilin PulG
MKIRCTKKSEKGGTLVEVIMATAILVIMLAGLLNSFGYGFFVAQLVRENQRATQIILEKVEIIRLYRWEQVNTPGFIPTTFADVYDPQSPDAPGITYQGTLEITPYPGAGVSYAPNIRQLVVTLTWNTGGKIAHTRTLATLIAKDGEQNYVY